MSYKETIKNIIELRKSSIINFTKEEDGLIYKIQYDLRSERVVAFSVEPIKK